MKTRKRMLSYIVFLLLTAATAPLYSTTVSYSLRSDWLAAVSSVTTTTFDASAPGYNPPSPGGNVSLGAGGITLNGVKFQGYSPTDIEYGLSIVRADTNSQYYNWGTGGAILNGEVYQGALAHLFITFTTPVTAWGSDLMLGNSPGGSFTVRVNGSAVCPNGACQTAAISFPSPVFMGMTSDTPFTSVDLYYTQNTRSQLDNFSTASAVVGGSPQGPGGETPELATTLLCATGLFALAKAKKVRSLVAA